MGPPFWLNSSLIPHSLAFSSLGRFCVNDYNAKTKTRIACNNSSGRFGIRSLVTHSAFVSVTQKEHLNKSFKL